MIEGLVHAQVIDSSGIEKDIDYLEGHGRGKEALEMLQGRDVVQETAQHNQIYSIISGSLLWRCFNCSDPGWSNYFWYTSGFPTFQNVFWGFVYLSTLDSTPSYGDNPTYYSSGYPNCNADTAQPSDWITAGAHKHLSEEIETHTCYSEALSTGRRSIYRTQKFLFTPSNFSSANIKSARWMMSRSDQYSYRAHINRYDWVYAAGVRFKDANGVNITLSKNSNQSLLFEYTVRFTSL